MHYGEPLFGEADADAVLGATKAVVSRMLDVGANMSPVTGGNTHRRVLGRDPASDQFRVGYLIPITDPDGSR